MRLPNGTVLTMNVEGAILLSGSLGIRVTVGAGDVPGPIQIEQELHHTTLTGPCSPSLPERTQNLALPIHSNVKS